MTLPDRIAQDVDPWRLYEAKKSAWSALHPDATSEQYEAAMKKIAEECGV